MVQILKEFTLLFDTTPMGRIVEVLKKAVSYSTHGSMATAQKKECLRKRIEPCTER